MGTSGRGRAGGRANERGSLYRSSFGAYLIACGLADRQVSFDAVSPGIPCWIWFESAAPVDDISVRFSSGARWDIQATARCDWGAKFRKTTAQWVSAARGGSLQPDDRVGLVAAKLSQQLLDLRDAFRRMREGGTLTPREASAIAKLRADARGDGWAGVFDEVASKAVILELACATELDHGFREAASFLDTTVVKTGSGLTAMAALRDFVHTEAARAGSSQIDRWIKVLTDAQLEIGPSTPSPGPVTAVRLAAYRSALAESLDQLPLHFLGLAAEPLVVANLLNRFRVELPRTDSHDGTKSGSLAEVARRWPALCVVGAAGAGKSTAMRQLAAAWATDVNAPVPIVVPMFRLIGPLRDAEPLSLASVVERSLAVDVHLTPVLVDRLRNGSAALILDGLDECRDQQDAAVQLIRRLADQLHPSAGLVVSARDAVVAKAAATGLPVARLAEPRDLSQVGREILKLIMRTTRPDHSAAELAQAHAWMSQSQSDHPDMWKVPLFSALLAAHAGRTSAASLPSNRAAALVAAIKDSVATWERIKQTETTAWHADLTPAQLIDGFTAIGHATADGSATQTEAVTQIVELLTSRWNLTAAAAQEKAEEVLAWWVGRVGAFTDNSGEIRAALRLFGEVADAMWASAQPDDVARSWMERAMADVTQYREPILLASSLNATMRTTLMLQAATPDAVLLAAKAIEVGIEATDEELAVVAQRLLDVGQPDSPPATSDGEGGVDSIAAVSDQNRRSFDGPTWTFRLALARLPPRGAVSDLQARAIAAETNLERQLVLGTCTVLARCKLEARPPTETEAELLRDLLDLPAPEPNPPATQESRRRRVFGVSRLVLPGRVTALAEAICLVGLTDEQARSAVIMTGLGTMSQYQELSDAIRKAGYAELLSVDGLIAGLAATSEVFAAIHEDCRQASFILTQAVEAAPHRSPGPSWRLEGAAALLEILGVGDQMIGHINWAVVKQPQLVTKLVEFALRSPQLNVPQVAADAITAADLVQTEPLQNLIFLCLPADPRRAVEPELPVPSEAELPWLRECARSPSNWLASCGITLISKMTGLDGDRILLADLVEINRNLREPVARALFDGIETNEVQTKWYTHQDYFVRAAAARVLGGRPLDPSQVDALVSDPDLTIRLAAMHGLAEIDGAIFERAATIALESAPTMWTCTDCGTSQPLDECDCSSCSHGSRPEIEQELKYLRQQRSQKTLS